MGGGVGVGHRVHPVSRVERSEPARVIPCGTTRGQSALEGRADLASVQVSDELYGLDLPSGTSLSASARDPDRTAQRECGKKFNI